MSDEERAAMIESARQTAKDFTWDAAADKTVAAFVDLISN